jgi:A/G-specific adenine glycosylase
MNISASLLRWYRKHKRDLPWRKTHDPYLIWLSEIILQQTRVAQGLPYYLKFSKKYPSIAKLAAAKQQEVLRQWQGLGYYSRARHLHETAKAVVKNFDGKFPSRYSELIKLKGVGEYTAAAVSSITSEEPHPVVDGNVIRVLSRHFGINNPLDSSSAKKKFISLASGLMANHSPSEFNQAMMEFGALQCVPKNPVCTDCPLKKSCFAFTHSQVEKFPVKKRKTKIRQRYFDYFIIHSASKILMKQRKENDIWKNLYDFPLIESQRLLSRDKFLQSESVKKIFGKAVVRFEKIGETQEHILSHQQLNARFWKVISSQKMPVKNDSGIISVNSNSLKKYPLPRLIERFIEKHNIFEY